MKTIAFALIVSKVLLGSPVRAQKADPGADLAKPLANPVASLISAPFQANWDFGIGPSDATRFTLSVQPMIPLSLNATFIQPFLSYMTKTTTTFTLNSEPTCDWEHDQWTVPLNVVVSQLFSVGSQPVQAFIGGRYYLESPEGGPEWGVRAGLTQLFPK